MNPARIIFPGFWFGKSDLAQAEELAKRGVGGFCVYGGTVKETQRFIEKMREASVYDHLLICADIEEDLSDILKEVPALPSNAQLGGVENSDSVYRKGLVTARLARSLGIDWLLAPVVDIGYGRPAFGENPMAVARLSGDYAAGAANGGVLNCIKYFPGINGILKTLSQMEDAEFVPYKHMFRRTDAVMPSDMIFSNIDPDNRAVMSEKIIKDLLKKRLNYKGCVIGTPLFKTRIKNEAAAVLKMIHCGVEVIMAPKDAAGAIEAVEREFEKEELTDAVIRGISNLELFTSKVVTNSAPVLDLKEALAQVAHFKK